MSDNAFPLSVLIVEDFEDAAESTAELLNALGHTARVCGCGADALGHVASEMPDVILLDIGLPGMSGWEVARRLRSGPDGKRPFIIAVTGYGTEQDRQHSADAGIDMHLVKPVAPETLIESLRWIYDSRHRPNPAPMRGFVRVCAWCQKVLIGGEWKPVDPGNYVAISHGMCPTCFTSAMSKFD